MPLTKYKIFSSAVIQSILGDSSLMERLYEFGFLPGVSIMILQKLPFHGPLIIKVKDTLVALRFDEAQCIVVSA